MTQPTRPTGMQRKRTGALQSTVLHEQVQDPAKGRVMMDEALDFRGNLYFGAVAACCVGCACWQRNFNLLQRWGAHSGVHFPRRHLHPLGLWAELGQPTLLWRCCPSSWQAVTWHRKGLLEASRC